MDPLAVLGAAAATAQFLEYSVKLVNSASEFYRSASGLDASLESDALVTACLAEFNLRLSSTPPSRALDASTDSGKHIVLLQTECHKTCTQLQQLIERIRVKNPPSWRRGFSGFSAAIKSRKYKGDVEELRKRLERHQTLFMQHLLVNLRDDQNVTLSSVENLGPHLEGVLVQQIETRFRETRDEILKIIPKESPTPANADLIGNIHKALSGLHTASMKINPLMKVLEILYFPDLRTRANSVAEAHEGTYRWLLHDPSSNAGQDSANFSSDHARYFSWSSQASPNSEESQVVTIPSVFYGEDARRQEWRDRLVRWLENGEGSFYISGKPGSGKSTLMKSVIKDSFTRELLRRWADQDKKQLLIGSFYFWSAGSSLQKGFYGMCRAIMWELLRQKPDLTQHVLPNLYRKAADGTLHESDLDPNCLMGALDSLMRNGSKSLDETKVCFFIDGLDECEDDHWRLSKRLVDWSLSPNVKICVSSRPHNEFVTAFGRGPWLKLHEMNRGDIQRMVRDDIEHMVRDQFTCGDPSSDVQRPIIDYDVDELTYSIVDKAEGVFIWVVMVMKKLLSCIRAAYSPVQVAREVDAVPTELSGMFRHMWRAIGETERCAAARVFLTMMLNPAGESNWWTYGDSHPGTYVFFQALLDELADQPESAGSLLDGTLCTEMMTPEDCVFKCHQMTRRLTKRCQGLIHFIRTENRSPFYHRIEFIHRTVRDFLMDGATQQELRKDSRDFDPDRMFALGLLAKVKNVWETTDEYQRSWQDAQGAEVVRTSNWPINEFPDWGPSMIMDLFLLPMSAKAKQTSSYIFLEEIESVRKMQQQCMDGDDERLLYGNPWALEADRPETIETAFMFWAIDCGALRYVKHKIEEKDLACQWALLIAFSMVGSREFSLPPEEYYEYKQREDIVQHLFSKQHVDPNLALRREDPNWSPIFLYGRKTQPHCPSPPWTLWGLVLMGISSTMLYQSPSSNSQPWWPMLDIFLENGAEQSMCFVGYRLPGSVTSLTDWEKLDDDRSNILDLLEGPFSLSLSSVLDSWGFKPRHGRSSSDTSSSGAGRTASRWTSLMTGWPASLLLPKNIGPPQPCPITELSDWSLEKSLEKSFLTLKVVPSHQVHAVKVSELEAALQFIQELLAGNNGEDVVVAPFKLHHHQILKLY